MSAHDYCTCPEVGPDDPRCAYHGIDARMVKVRQKRREIEAELAAIEKLRITSAAGAERAAHVEPALEGSR